MPLEKVKAGIQFESVIGSTTSSPVSPIRQETILRTDEEIFFLLRKSRNFFRPLDISKIIIALEGLSASVSSETETKLNAHLRDCGCLAGSVAATTGIFVYVALLPVIVGWPSAWRWKHLFIGIGVCFGMATLGKIFGLLRARVRLVRELEVLWENCRNIKPCRTGG
jgi:hypothetical protein